MLDLALIRAEPARVKASLARRGVGAEAVDAVIDLDARRSSRQEVLEALRVRRRRISDEVARRRTALRTGPDWDADTFDAPDLVQAGREVARQLHAVETEMADLAARRDRALLVLPNLPMTDVPDEPAAPAVGDPAWHQPFAPLAHWDLIEMLGLARTAGETAGRGFLVWRGPGARLVRALVEWMLDVHTREGGCEEVRAPSVATRAALTGSAHLPLLEDKMYAVAPHATDPATTSRDHRDPSRDHRDPSRDREGAVGAAHDLFLAPRAEPHLAGLYAGQVLDDAALPVRLVAAGNALRRESHGGGAAGRGLLRLHEFPTVELYTFCRPGRADAELERAIAAAETILARLGAAYRRRLRPAPHLSHAAARTVDLDVWAPGTGRWLDVAAVSTFTDYQARRTNTRCRDAQGRTRLVHTVGGAAVAVPHLVAALLENGQQEDGSVRLPEALAGAVGETIRRHS